jgi:hypothetical protein
MPSPDERLPELRRQRALVREQLAWLDREIASASGEAKPPGQIPPSLPAAHLQPTAPPADGNEVGELMKSFEEESRSSIDKAKQGCIWFFAAAFVLFALCLFAFAYYVKLHQSPPVR